jgi:hypothetical protein
VCQICLFAPDVRDSGPDDGVEAKRETVLRAIHCAEEVRLGGRLAA